MSFELLYTPNLVKSKLYELEMQKKNSAQQALEDTKADITWGSQIRSYVQHPYKMVKDHRTDVEVRDVDDVLEGDIQKFLDAEREL